MNSAAFKFALWAALGAVVVVLVKTTPALAQGDSPWVSRSGAPIAPFNTQGPYGLREDEIAAQYGTSGTELAPWGIYGPMTFYWGPANSGYAYYGYPLTSMWMGRRADYDRYGMAYRNFDQTGGAQLPADYEIDRVIPTGPAGRLTAVKNPDYGWW